MSKQGTNGPSWERLRTDENGWEWFKAKDKKTSCYKILPRKHVKTQTV